MAIHASKPISQVVCIPILGAALLLSSCASVPCDINDPNQDTWTKMQCRDVYRQENEALTIEIKNRSAVNARLQQVAAALQAEQAELRGELAAGRAEFRTLNESVNALLAELEGEAKTNDQLQSRIDSIRETLAAVNENEDDTSMIQKRQQLNELQSSVGGLERALGYDGDATGPS